MRLGADLCRSRVKATALEPPLLRAARMASPDTVRFVNRYRRTWLRTAEGVATSAGHRMRFVRFIRRRYTSARESVKKPEVPATRNYREILDRKDVDAIIAVTDHQHVAFEDACAAGKDVYCEKPMSHTVEDGFAMVDAAHKANRIAQIGSQRVSSILYAKAKEIYDSGKLGDVFFIDAYWDRNSASGAWVYPVPPDASEQTIDWNAFLNGAPKRSFDPVRFFRWRCFTDYGEGLAGDLFVHLISGIQFITSTNTIAQRAQSTGGLFRWKDGLDFPDLIDTFYDYPNFRVAVR